MQLAVEMMLEREGLSAAEFRDQALACGRRGVTSLWHEGRHERAHGTQPEDTDGI
ncbi:Uncharacterised protein [Edwardsiella hoshinae]|uniref:Uncharacterized protein n=1 Tax=Edwardsiella hoshinae TaxID=93378 RepID=A0A376DJU8_9GAMM|nr:Uncharacterised protein [Edwardsiella hoshinae]